MAVIDLHNVNFALYTNLNESTANTVTHAKVQRNSTGIVDYRFYCTTASWKMPTIGVKRDLLFEALGRVYSELDFLIGSVFRKTRLALIKAYTVVLLIALA